MAFGLLGAVNPEDYTLDSMEPGSERPRPARIRLAASTTAVSLSTTAAELPSGLVIYPSFKGHSSIEFALFAELTNTTGTASSVHLEILADGTSVATIDSPQLGSNFGDPTLGYWGARLWMTATSTTAQCIYGMQVYRDQKGTVSSGQTANIGGTISSSAIDFSADVVIATRLTLDYGTGTLKHYHIVQDTPRSGW